MKYCKILSVAFSWTLLISPMTSASAMTLEEALVSAYNYSPTIKAEKNALKSTAELSNQARSGWLPNVRYNYQRSREGRNLSASYDSLNTSYSKQFFVSQPVFNGFSTINQIAQAKNQFESAKASYGSTEQNTLFDTVSAYMDVVRETEVLKLNENNEEVLRKHLQVTRERFRLGEVTKTDVAQAKARLAVAITDRAESLGNMEIARANFKRVVGQEIYIDSIETDPVLPDTPSSLTEVIETATKNHPALLQAKYAEKAAKDNIAVTRAQLMPSVTLEGNMREDKGTNIAGNGVFENKSIGFNVNVPIFQSGSEYSGLRQSKHRASQSTEEYQQTYDSVEQFAIRVWHDFNVAKQTLESTEQGVVAAKIALDGVTQEALVGSRTTLDVLDAEQELFSARVENVRAKRNHVVASYNILSALGKLTANDIKLDVEAFDPDAYYESVKYKFIGLN